MEMEENLNEAVEVIAEAATEAGEAVAEEVKKVAKRGRKAAAKGAARGRKAAEKAAGAVDDAAKAVRKATGAAKPEVYVQYDFRESNVNDIVEAAKAAFKAEKGRTAIKSLKVYVKPQENAAYYVINGDYSGKIDL
jgi:hypothetical protein